MKRYPLAVLLLLVVLGLTWQALGELPPAPIIRLQPGAPAEPMPALKQKIRRTPEQYTYKLTSPLPHIVERGAIQPGLSSYAAFFCMFQSSDGKMHLLAPFNLGNSWRSLYVNLSDAAATLIGGPGEILRQVLLRPGQKYYASGPRSIQSLVHL